MNNILKISVLQLLLENKDVVFGKFSETLSFDMKVSKWKDIAEQAKALNALDSSKDWKYLRDTIWQNWRKRTIEKIDNRKRTGSGGSKKCVIDESDKIILEILGRDSPIIEGLPVCEPSGDNTSTTAQYKKSDGMEEQIPRKRHRLELRSKSQQPVVTVEGKILDFKLKILERECFLKDLEILKKETELKLAPSEFTKKLYHNNSENVNDLWSQAISDVLEGSDD